MNETVTIAKASAVFLPWTNSAKSERSQFILPCGKLTQTALNRIQNIRYSGDQDVFLKLEVNSMILFSFYWEKRRAETSTGQIVKEMLLSPF